MRRSMWGVVLAGVLLAAGSLEAEAQPWHGPDGGGPSAAVPVADYPEPRFGYGEPPPARRYDPYYGRPDGYSGPGPRFARPEPGRYREEDDEPGPEGFDSPEPGYGDGYAPRPRCWISRGYDGPERVCR